MKDYGHDPIGNGMFKMVPSGDIVSAQEMHVRLGHKIADLESSEVLIFGMTLDELESKQGGILNREIIGE